MMLLAALPANLLIAAVYRAVEPGAAGMILLATLVLVLVAKALLLGDGAPSPRLWISTAAAMAAAAWVAHELHRGA